MKKDYLYLIIAGIFSGVIVFGGKVFSNLGLSLYEIAIFPLVITLIIMLPYVFIKRQYLPSKDLFWVWVGYGLIGALLTLAEYTGVILGVPVAIAVLLLYTQPLWTIIFSSLFMKEKTTKNQILACFIVLTGIVVLVNPFNIKEIGTIPGLIIALIGGILLSGWVLFGSYASKRKSHHVTTLFAESIATLIFLILFYPLVILLTKNPSLISLSFNWPVNIWIYLVIFAILTKLVVHLSYFKGITHVPTIHGGIILLLEPISGSLLAALFLSQALTSNIIIGGSLILIANYLVIAKK